MTPDIEKQLKELKKKLNKGVIRESELSRKLESLLNQGLIRVSRDESDPFSPVRITSKKPNNPMSGKGKNYGQHVEGGWGKYVKPTNSESFDELYLNDWADPFNP